MQDGILKFPKPLKENKNITNDTSVKLQKTTNDRPITIKPTKKFERDIKNLTTKELENENKMMVSLIAEQEKKIEVLSRNEKIKELFNMRAFVSDNYHNFVTILEEYKNIKSLELKQKERREKLETFYYEDQKRKKTIKDADKSKKNLEEKIRRLQGDIDEIQIKNKKYQDQLNKKDFFREYDYMNKEVEGLKKQNENLEIMLKKIQEKTDENNK